MTPANTKMFIEAENVFIYRVTAKERSDLQRDYSLVCCENDRNGAVNAIKAWLRFCWNWFEKKTATGRHCCIYGRNLHSTTFAIIFFK